MFLTPRLPDAPGVESLSSLIPAQRSAEPALLPPARELISPAPVPVGRDTRLAMLWTLLGDAMGVLLLVAVLALLPPLPPLAPAG